MWEELAIRWARPPRHDGVRVAMWTTPEGFPRWSRRLPLQSDRTVRNLPARNPRTSFRILSHETYLSAQRAPTQAQAWLPSSHADAARPRHREASPCQGSHSPQRLTHCVTAPSPAGTVSPGFTRRAFAAGEVGLPWWVLLVHQARRWWVSLPESGSGTPCGATEPNGGFGPPYEKRRSGAAGSTW